MTLDDLAKEIDGLSDADFFRLARRFGLTQPRRLQYATVEIKDKLNKDDPKAPVAIVEYADRSKEAIDIFATIRNNVAGIGHPVVILALRHWQQILQHQRALTFKDVWDDKELFKGFREYFTGVLPEIASENLAKVSEALLEGAKEGSIPRAEAFVAVVENYGLDKEDTLLHISYEWLRQSKTRNKELKLKELEDRLRKERSIGGHITADRVLGFLRSDKGRNYLKPRTWEAMRNAFLAWFFDFNTYTVKRYFSTAKNRKDKAKYQVNTRFLHPRYNKYMLSEAGVWPSHPVVPHEINDEDDDEDFEPTFGWTSVDKSS